VYINEADAYGRGNLAAMITSKKPDVCVHLAAITTIAEAQDESRAWETNSLGALNLSHAILRHAPECQLLYASSPEVYGAGSEDRLLIDEITLLAPANVVVAGRAAADLTFGAMAAEDGSRAVRFRLFNYTGPGQPAEFTIPAFARQVARIAAGLQSPVLEVDLGTWGDFLDVRDVCEAYIAAIARRSELPTGIILTDGERE
jgi:GDP-4-dehydro-6-deoxy-D-mannose reductase